MFKKLIFKFYKTPLQKVQAASFLDGLKDRSS